MSRVYYKYPATLFFDEDGITVEFPDLPGCITCGDNEEEAIRMAIECLTLHIYGLEKDNDPIPEPTPIEKIKLVKNQKIILIETDRAIRKQIRDA